MFADISIEVVLKTSFLLLFNANIGSTERLVWRSYIMKRPCLLFIIEGLSLLKEEICSRGTRTNVMSFENTCLDLVGYQNSAFDFRPGFSILQQSSNRPCCDCRILLLSQHCQACLLSKILAEAFIFQNGIPIRNQKAIIRSANSDPRLLA